ncbi:MAG TPA: hypothetical protein PKX92_10060 [Edaphocola sp.]|nr:hypothetical protein [Edaphocola sp.]
MDNLEKKKKELTERFNMEKANLPLSMPFWKISIYNKESKMNDKPKSHSIKLGKYKAELRSISPFYKPYSKIFLI